ncbi:MAG: PAS domain-containing protein [Candidatus Promineifilaceae bacterium]
MQRPDGALVYANPAAARLIGYPSPQALLEASLTEITARFELSNADGRPLAAAALPGRRALQGDSPPEMAVRFRGRQTGQERWSAVTGCLPSRRFSAGTGNGKTNLCAETSRRCSTLNRRPARTRSAPPPCSSCAR